MQGHVSSPVQPGSVQYVSENGASRYRNQGSDRGRQLVKTLGWFSIGMGIAQLLAPRQMSRAVGASDSPKLMRSVGAREIAAGVGILSQRSPAPWLWARVAGDMMDLAMLGVAGRNAYGSRQRSRLGVATAVVAGLTVLDVLTSLQNSKVGNAGPGQTIAGGIRVEKSINVHRSPEECYQFWRNFEQFPRFMKHLESVQVLEGNRSHWKATGPAGLKVEWDAEVTADQPGQLLSWRSVEGADVDNAGTVRFERGPGGRGTIVRVELEYNPPGGKAGALVAKLFGQEPTQQIDEDLRRFKWLIETGEIPTTVGQASGPRDSVTRTLIKKGLPG